MNSKVCQEKEDFNARAEGGEHEEQQHRKHTQKTIILNPEMFSLWMLIEPRKFTQKT